MGLIRERFFTPRPRVKSLDGFKFAGTPIDEALVRDLANGGFLAGQRNVVPIGGTGTGKI